MKRCPRRCRSRNVMMVVRWTLILWAESKTTRSLRVFLDPPKKGGVGSEDPELGDLVTLPHLLSPRRFRPCSDPMSHRPWVISSHVWVVYCTPTFQLPNSPLLCPCCMGASMFLLGSRMPQSTSWWVWLVKFLTTYTVTLCQIWWDSAVRYV